MEESKALVEFALDSVRENKKHAKRWFIVALVSNVIWMLLVVFIVVAFLKFESQFEYSTETTETTVTQESGENGNNIYQSGDHATYNEGGELNGEAGDQVEDDKDN